MPPGRLLKNLLLTGTPGCGKTTVIQRLHDRLGDLRVRGFYTQKLRERGQRVGFEAVGLSGGRAVLAHVRSRSKLRVGPVHGLAYPSGWAEQGAIEKRLVPCVRTPSRLPTALPRKGACAGKPPASSLSRPRYPTCSQGVQRGFCCAAFRDAVEANPYAAGVKPEHVAALRDARGRFVNPSNRQQAPWSVCRPWPGPTG